MPTVVLPATQPSKGAEYQRHFRQTQPEKARIIKRRWRLKHKDQINAANRKRRIKWRLANPIQPKPPKSPEKLANLRIRHSLGSRIHMAVKKCRTKKITGTMKLLGCDIHFLRGYLEARFQSGMSWSNYGKWHIDHHIPCVEFDLRDPDQQRQCFHYSNLRPLWGLDNISKNAKRPPTHQAELI